MRTRRTALASWTFRILVVSCNLSFITNSRHMDSRSKGSNSQCSNSSNSSNHECSASVSVLHSVLHKQKQKVQNVWRCNFKFSTWISIKLVSRGLFNDIRCTDSSSCQRSYTGAKSVENGYFRRPLFSGLRVLYPCVYCTCVGRSWASLV